MQGNHLTVYLRKIRIINKKAICETPLKQIAELVNSIRIWFIHYLFTYFKKFN